MESRGKKEVEWETAAASLDGHGQNLEAGKEGPE